MTILNLLAVAVGIGLILTLVITETFGLAAGGLVVPGYMALSLLQPWSFALTLLVALATFVVVRTLAIYIIVFGRRRTALMIVTGYLLGALVDLLIGGGIFVQATAMANGTAQGSVSVGQPWFFEVSVIGYIIPGLIAIWFDRQGILATITGLMLTSVLVRLCLVMAMPQALQNYDAAQAHHLIEWSRLFMEP